mgnify:CR=1 FL=1
MATPSEPAGGRAERHIRTPAFGGWEKEEQAGHRALPVPGCRRAGVAPRAALDLNLRSRLPARVLLPGGERPAPTEAGAEIGAWTVATGDPAPSGYEGWLVMTYSAVGPYAGVLAGGCGGDCPHRGGCSTGWCTVLGCLLYTSPSPRD